MSKRIISAIVLIPLAVWLILFANPTFFAVSIIIIGSVAYIEWLNMTKTKFNTTKLIYTLSALSFLCVFIFYKDIALYFLIFIFILHMVIGFASVKTDLMFENYYMFGGILYISLYPFLYFIMKEKQGRNILMLLFVSIWAGDSFAYFCGKRFGKHKMAKVISPHKTIEGGVCGVVLGALFGVIFAYFFNLPELKMFLIAFVANIFGIIGDLAESVIKRSFNKKDSSNIIPGHGGVLDRFDSIAFAGFIIYIITSWKIL